VPIKYLSDRQLRNAAVISGVKDDHGGGGIGQFRDLKKQSGEWHGGGSETDKGGSNIYDLLLLRK
jgi:hypothetical protein